MHEKCKTFISSFLNFDKACVYRFFFKFLTRNCISVKKYNFVDIHEIRVMSHHKLSNLRCSSFCCLLPLYTCFTHRQIYMFTEIVNRILRSSVLKRRWNKKCSIISSPTICPRSSYPAILYSIIIWNGSLLLTYSSKQKKKNMSVVKGLFSEFFVPECWF